MTESNSVSMMSTLFGWNLHQWGIAIQRYGWSPINVRGAYDLVREWQSRNPSKPGEIKLIGIEYPADWFTAASMFVKVLPEASYGERS